MKVSIDEAKAMKVVDLRNALKQRGAPQSGKKEELLSRLLTILESEEESPQQTLTESFDSEIHSLGKNTEVDESSGLVVSAAQYTLADNASEVISSAAVVNNSNGELPIDANSQENTADSSYISDNPSANAAISDKVTDDGRSIEISGIVIPDVNSDIIPCLSAMNETPIPSSEIVPETSVSTEITELPVASDESTSNSAVEMSTDEGTAASVKDGISTAADEITFAKEELEPALMETLPTSVSNVTATSTEISALLGDNSVEEEDDEQRELREVEERKLREAVKMSMARQAVKKSITLGTNSAGSDSSSSATRSATLKSSKLKPNNLTVSSDDDHNSISAHVSSPANPSNPLDTSASHRDVTDEHNASSTSPLVGNQPHRSSSSATQIVNKSPAVNPVSRFLRIDNFQRPLKIDSLQSWLQTRLGHAVPLENLWINAIKTHCYVTFDTEEQAVACRESVNGHLWTTTSPTPLLADFTQVSAQDAPTSPEAMLKPGLWLNRPTSARIRTPLAAEPRETSFADSQPVPPSATDGATPSSSARPAEYQTRKLTSGAGGAMLGVLRNAATSAANSTRVERQTRIDGNEETGFSTKRYREGDVGAGSASTGSASTSAVMKRLREVGGEDATKHSKSARTDDKAEARGTNRVIETGPSLEDLFRKTSAKPHLYWLPVGDDEIARRRGLRGC